jgi:hypothetical protein
MSVVSSQTLTRDPHRGAPRLHSIDIPLAMSTLNVRKHMTLSMSLNPLDKRSPHGVISRLMSTDTQDISPQDALPVLVSQLKGRETELKSELEQIQQVLDGLEKLALFRTTNDPPPPNTSASVPTQTPLGPHGLPVGFSRRQAVEQIITEYNGKQFDSRELRERLVAKYPQANTKSLAQSVTNILKDKFDKGKLKRLGRRGDGPNDPFIYQQVEDHEGNLLEP